MGCTTKYFDFDSWLDACVDLGYSVSDIKEDTNEYFFEAGGFKIAYWDREKQFGYVSLED